MQIPYDRQPVDTAREVTIWGKRGVFVIDSLETCGPLLATVLPEDLVSPLGQWAGRAEEGQSRVVLGIASFSRLCVLCVLGCQYIYIRDGSTNDIQQVDPIPS